MTDTAATTTEAEAHRLETVNREIAALLRRPEVAQRLRAAGPDEWSALQILGHLSEMIPYWMAHARALAAASGDPPTFGRGLDAPERLDAVQRSASSDPDELLRRLDGEIGTAAASIRGMSVAERAKQGIHIRRGAMTVADVIGQLIVQHAVEHEAQLKQVLGL